jgi:hypothetical protein
MTHQSHGQFAGAPLDAGRQFAQLRHVLGLVEELAGRATRGRADDALAEGAEVSGVYLNALPIVRRRFDALAAETTAWSAAGVEALLRAGELRSRAAASQLANELQRSIADLLKLLRA